MKRSAMRRGLSRMDVVATLTALCLLMMLVSPMLGCSREKNRRASCSVKLKYLAMALHTYHDNYGQLPASAFYKGGQNLADRNIKLAAVVPGTSTGDTRSPYSFIVKLLPYFEKGYLFDQIDVINNDAFAGPTTAVAAQVIPVLICPSFRGAPNSSAADYSSPKPALTNFKALGATTLECLQDPDCVRDTIRNGGALHPYASYSFNMLKAPTQTAVLTETKEPKYAAWFDGTTASIPGFHPGTGNVKEDGPSPPVGKPALNLQSSGNQSTFMSTSQFGGREDMQWGPSSDHPGLVVHAMGGTETKAIANDVDPIVYRALISRRDTDNGDLADFFK